MVEECQTPVERESVLGRDGEGVKKYQTLHCWQSDLRFLVGDTFQLVDPSPHNELLWLLSTRITYLI